MDLKTITATLAVLGTTTVLSACDDKKDVNEAKPAAAEKAPTPEAPAKAEKPTAPAAAPSDAAAPAGAAPGDDAVPAAAGEGDAAKKAEGACGAGKCGAGMCGGKDKEQAEDKPKT